LTAYSFVFIIAQCDYGPLIQTRLGFSMEDLFAGSGAAGGGGGGGGGGGAAAEAAAAEPVKEKEAFDLKLTEVPAAAKIKVIKEVRAITGLGLKEVTVY
jgi:large subunit ribosomal protein L7/L12